MPALPWTTVNPPDRQREYLALLSFLPLRRYRSLPRFMLYTVKVMQQLKHAPGLMGYSLLAELGKKQFWTLSVWESDDALGEFVRQLPHRMVMQNLDGKMRQTGFWRWQVQGSELPLRWEEARKQREAALR